MVREAVVVVVVFVFGTPCLGLSSQALWECGKRVSQRFPHFHRAGTLSFFLVLFLSLWKSGVFHEFSAEMAPRSDDGAPNRVPSRRWGCGSWGQRSLVDRSV